VREVAGEAQQHGRALLGRQRVDALPHAAVADVRALGRRHLGKVADGHGPPLARAEVVERLAVRDG
jgi:hypothetical protein